METLRAYFGYIKQKKKPELTPQSQEVFKAYYRIQRRIDEGTDQGMHLFFLNFLSFFFFFVWFQHELQFVCWRV